MRRIIWFIFLMVCNGALANTIPLIIDTDPALGIKKNGKFRDVDDGLMIIEALNHKETKVLGISTVFGNSEVDQGFLIAQRILKLKDKKIPLFKGASSGFHQDQKCPSPGVAKFLFDLIKDEDQVNIAAVGPLTNIACLLRSYPKSRDKIRQIIAVMGRSKGHKFYIGGRGPVRDFNFAKDPIGAEIVLSSGVPVVLAPFELSIQVSITDKDLMSIKNRKTEASAYLYETAKGWHDFWLKSFPGEKGFHPWDSMAFAYLTQPTILNCEKRGFRVKSAASMKPKSESHILELDHAFPSARMTYCHGLAISPAQMSRRIIKGVY